MSQKARDMNVPDTGFQRELDPSQREAGARREPGDWACCTVHNPGETLF